MLCGSVSGDQPKMFVGQLESRTGQLHIPGEVKERPLPVNLPARQMI